MSFDRLRSAVARTVERGAERFASLPVPVPPLVRRVYGHVLTRISGAEPTWHEYQGYSLLLDPSEPAGARIARGDSHEPVLVEWMERELSRGGTVLDVGSHWGEFVAVMRRCVGPEGRVVAFEPSPRHADCLRDAVDKNDWTNVDVRECAVADVSGEAHLRIHGQNTGGSTILPRRTPLYTEQVAVQTVTLAEVFDESAFDHVDFIKIDVEGAEVDVIEGLGERLNDVSRMVVEVHHAYLSDERRRTLYTRLADYGRLTTLTDEAIETIDDFASHDRILWQHDQFDGHR